MQMILPLRATLRVVQLSPHYYAVDSQQIPGLHVKGITREAAITVAKKAIPKLAKRAVRVTDVSDSVIEIVAQ